jgi:DNA-binding MarR family transcriptional regulator
MTDSKANQRVPATEADACARALLHSLNQILDYLAAALPAEAGICDTPWTIQEVRVLRTILARGEVSMSVLAAALGVSLPTASHIVERLVEKGAVVRAGVEHDRRVVLVKPSYQAWEERRRFLDRQTALLAPIIEPLALPDRARLGEVFREIERLVQSSADLRVR